MSPRVLVVDDSLTVRMDLRDAFEAAGLAVTACATVEAARSAIAGTAFGVAVLDVVLPDGDGISLLEELRRAPRNAGVPVMLLSTETEVRDRVRGLARGADEYVGKPYDPSYVVARVKELLRKGAPGARAGDRRTVLLIDDSPTLRAELGAALVAGGYRVVDAESGEKGLRAAAEERPDAVILDGLLPGIDGYTVLRRMKLDVALRRTPVLMLTSSEQPGDEVRALEAGADAFVHKDEEAGAMLARLAAILRGVEELPAADLPASSLGPKRILAVDDSAAALEQLSEQLRQEGYDVVLARSGEEALELVAVQRVDCILLDLAMPGLSGLDTCRRMREVERTRDVPILIVGSAEDGASLIEGIEAGADDFVTGSADFDVLRARVRAQLRRRQLEEENRKLRERRLRQEHEAAEARSAQDLAAVRAELLADVERKNRELREADRRKNEFLGILSHELRNPLAPIRNALFILGHAPPASEQAHRAKAILDRQVEHLTRLVDDLLDVTRISRGKIQLQRVRLDLADVLRRTVEDHERLLAERGIGLDVRVEPGPFPVDADPARITQIVGNLLHNSAKFTDSGGRVDISLRREGGDAVVVVADSGVGIALEMLGRVFEPFTQADDSLHRSRGGLGLGLALVKGLVEQHGGTIQARSEGIGRGSEFTVRLPLAAGAGPTADAQERDEAPPAPRRVLVVEDNVDGAQTLRELLAMAGHETEIAYDGRTALAKARAFHPDVALCDVGLPGMDGYAVARAFRADPLLASTVLVALTGYALPDDQRKAVEAGFDAHLAKPATPAQLERVLSTRRRDGFRGWPEQC
jgi:DNA-binding response OmpR family regulator